MKTWIVVAHRTEAKVFSYSNKSNAEVEFVTKLENPRGRLKAQDINSDKPGVFSGAPSHGTGRESTESPTERIAQEFAKKVSDFLEFSRHKQHFDEVVLIAEPHFLGRLRGLLSRPLTNCISRTIGKDLGTVTVDDLKSRLWPKKEIQISL